MVRSELFENSCDFGDAILVLEDWYYFVNVIGKFAASLKLVYPH
jgi:hypothetical protein